MPGVSLEAVSASAGVKEVPSLESFLLDMRQAVVLIGVAMEMVDSVLVYEKFMKDVTKFLNRILGLKLHVQNMVSILCIAFPTASMYCCHCMQSGCGAPLQSVGRYCLVCSQHCRVPCQSLPVKLAVPPCAS